MKTILYTVGLTCLSVTSTLASAAESTTGSTNHVVTANIGIFSSYRFRGIDQTFGKPALQGGMDYSHSSGLYLGNWNSNVQPGAGYPDATLEMDFYGGYKWSVDAFSFDTGIIHYAYPGSDSAAGKPGAVMNYDSGKVHDGSVRNTEIYIGANWQILALKYYHAVSDYFSTPNTRNSNYIDLSLNVDLGDGWGLNGHAGYLDFKNQLDGDYGDWKAGVTKTLASWTIALSGLGTTAKGNCSKAETYCFVNSSATDSKDAGRNTAVISLGRSF